MTIIHTDVMIHMTKINVTTRSLLTDIPLPGEIK